MSRKSNVGADNFDFQHLIFGVYDPEAQRLVLAVEASSEADAMERVATVVPYLGIKDSESLEVVQLEEVPSAVSIFFEEFFGLGKDGFNKFGRGPGTATLQ
jgi:hypothetical protein